MRQKKVVWIVVGLAIVAGIGYWLYKKRKEKATKTAETVTPETKTKETIPTPQATSRPIIEVVRIIAPAGAVIERSKPTLGTTSGSAVGTEYRANVVPVGGQMMLVVPTRSGGRYVINEVG